MISLLKVAYPDKSQTVYDKMVAYNPDEKKNQPKYTFILKTKFKIMIL